MGVIAVDHPRTRSVLQRLADAGIKLITIASDVPAAPCSAYVGAGQPRRRADGSVPDGQAAARLFRETSRS